MPVSKHAQGMWPLEQPASARRAYHADPFFKEPVMANTVSEQQEQLVKDLRAVMHDAQQLLNTGVEGCSAQASQTRQRLASVMAELQQTMSECRPNVRQRLSQWQHASDDYVHHHPWSTVGAALVLGMMTGWVLSRR
jgi:ElaB/YqjD/DUF883 family membrane-anchored ribosome-binding protein